MSELEHEQKLSTAQIKEEVSKLYRSFKALTNFQDMLAVLENIEGTTAEKLKELENLKNDCSGLKKMKEDAEESIRNAQAKCKTDATEALSYASTEIDSMLKAAKDKAEKLVSEAKALADKHMNTANDLAAAAAKNNAALLTAKEELNSIQSAIDQHKSDLQKFLK